MSPSRLSQTTKLKLSWWGYMVGSAGFEPAPFTQEWRKAILYGFLQVTAPELRHPFSVSKPVACLLEPVVMPGLTTTPIFLVISSRAYLYIIERDPEKALLAALPLARRTNAQKSNVTQENTRASYYSLHLSHIYYTAINFHASEQTHGYVNNVCLSLSPSHTWRCQSLTSMRK